jgi:hypothetical protein
MNIDLKKDRYHGAVIYEYFCGTNYLESTINISHYNGSRLDDPSIGRYYWDINIGRYHGKKIEYDKFIAITWFDTGADPDDLTKHIIGLVIANDLHTVEAMYELKQFKLDIKKDQERMGFK